MAHNKAERAARMAMDDDAAVAASWYLVVDHFRDNDYYGKGGLWELEKLDEQSTRGHFLMVCYDVDRVWYVDPDDEDPGLGVSRPELFVREHALEWLRDTFYGRIEYSIKRFENYFVAKGVLQAELALAAAEAAGIEVPRPVIIPYVCEEPEWKTEWREGKLPWAVYPSRWLDGSYVIRRKIDGHRYSDDSE